MTTLKNWYFDLSVSVVLVLFALWIPCPGAAMPATQSCSCALTHPATYPDVPPSCYLTTIITLESLSDGNCGNTGCGAVTPCKYALTITAKAQVNADPPCDFAFTKNSGQVAVCLDCFELAFSTDGIIDLSCNSTDVWQVWACNNFPAPCGTPMANVFTVTFICANC